MAERLAGGNLAMTVRGDLLASQLPLKRCSTNRGAGCWVLGSRMQFFAHGKFAAPYTWSHSQCFDTVLYGHRRSFRMTFSNFDGTLLKAR
jgi:hypothetical protein